MIGYGQWFQLFHEDPCKIVLFDILNFVLKSYTFLLYNFRYFPKKVEKFSSMLEENASRLPYFLLSLRLLPISPNWAVNMCCGVLDVPITTFFLTVLIGLMPYNYICVTTGVILSKLTSINDIFTWTTMLQMSGVALMATLPAFLSKKQKKKPSPLPSKIEWNSVNSKIE